MEITVGSSTSTASRCTTRTARPNLSSFPSLLALYYGVRKTKTASVHPPHPPAPSPPLGVEGELRKVGAPLQAYHKLVRGFLCVFVSLREPLEPLARPQRAMLRGIDMLRGHATERSWLPLRPLGREQGAGGMRVGSSTPLRTLSELVLASNTPQEPIRLS